MKTIPLSAALQLLALAADVVVSEHPATTCFTFDPDLEDFMGITAEDGENEFNYTFSKALNAEVKIDGEVMTLVADSDGEDNPEPMETEMRLHIPLQLEEAIKHI